MNYEGSAPRPSLTIRKGWPRFVLKPEPGKPGRPRKDELRKRVRELKKTMSWPELTRKLNQETGENLSQRTTAAISGPLARANANNSPMRKTL